MVKVHYSGLPNPKAAFDDLRPFRQALLTMEHAHRPFGPDYLILSAVTKALDTAAFHFTGDPTFFAIKPEQSKGG